MPSPAPRWTKYPPHEFFNISSPTSLQPPTAMPPQKAILAKIRPLGSPTLEKATLQWAARVYVSKDSLIALTGALDGGKACTIARTGEDGQTVKREASLHVLSGQNISPNVVQMSKAFQEAAGLKIGDQVTIEALDEPVREAEEVLLEDITKDPKDERGMSMPLSWEAGALVFLGRAEQAFPGMILESVRVVHYSRSFKVVSIDGRGDAVANINLKKTTVRILQAGEAEDLANGSKPQGELILKDIPGLKEQVRQINVFLHQFKDTPILKIDDPSCALMIEGGKGTGKTFLLEALAKTNWGRVFRIEESDKSSAVREKFTQARSQQPSMIFIDDIQTIVSSEGTDRRPVITALKEELDALSAASVGAKPLAQTLVVATCTDRLKDVPARLKEDGRFYRTVVLPIPKTPERLQILRYHAEKHIREEEKESILSKLAEETYAYSCRDLKDLVNSAIYIRYAKGISEFPPGEIPEDYKFLTKQDFVEAKREVPASLMQDIHLQPQTVKWGDIGGQEDVKKILSRMIKQTKVRLRLPCANLVVLTRL